MALPRVFRRAALLAPLTALTGVLAACSSTSTKDGEEGAAAASETTASQLSLCAAMRGNGHYIITHFASLARILEHYGVVDGMAGGSSGTVSTYVYESMLKNPATRTCGKGDCSDVARATRIALLSKSLQGYIDTVGDGEEAVAVKSLAGTVAKLKADVDARGIGALVTTDAARAASELLTVLEQRDLTSLVNPESLAMLRDTEHLEYNVKEVYESVRTLGAFSVDNNRLFFRPGAIGFDAVADKLGRVGDFYAGYGPADGAGTQAFLDGCADAGRGKPWSEVKDLHVGQTTCGEMFGHLLREYRAKLPAAEGTFRHRVDEEVGAYAPLATLLSTSVLVGESVSQYEEARRAYLSGAHPQGENIPFAPSFEDIKFGYWGSAKTLATVDEARPRNGDAKAAKFHSLGQATWRHVLSLSPAEPGLSRFREIGDGTYSAGGWSDLAPVQVLKYMGCKRVVYVQREGDESPFATKIAKHLGMDETAWKEIFDLGNADSGYSRAVAAADAVWCTNWNSFGDLEVDAMARDAYAPPMEVRAASFREGTPAYPKLSDSTGKVGCTPGVSGGAKFPE